jgi:PTH2 family peptidyl-tRNA hydrolase
MGSNMREAKQVIVVRKDLNMRKGKMVAQGSHASLGVILNAMTKSGSKMTLDLSKNEALEAWIEGRFKKVCVSVDSEDELIDVYNKAKAKGLLCVLITDSGLTEFGGVPTKTTVAIGPAFPEDVDSITGGLKLL